MFDKFFLDCSSLKERNLLRVLKEKKTALLSAN